VSSCRQVDGSEIKAHKDIETLPKVKAHLDKITKIAADAGVTA
jgi:hypothetical protein